MNVIDKGRGSGKNRRLREDSVVEETVSDAIAEIVSGTEAYDPFESSERKRRERSVSAIV